MTNRLLSFPLPRSRVFPPMADDSDMLDLVRLRVAQIHRSRLGQQHYLDKLRQAGESEMRLDELETWPVSTAYNPRERLSLGLAEVLAQPLPGESTLLPRLLHQASDAMSRAELVRLVLAVEAMQDWELCRENFDA